jgi:sec-independent protein translocase protein TatB
MARGRALVLLVARSFCYIGSHMLGIGFWEMLVIAVLILVAVGPDRLPAMIKQVAKFYRQFRRTAEDLRASTGIDDLLRDEELRELADFRKQKLALMAQPKPPIAKPPVATPVAGATPESIPATQVSSPEVAPEAKAVEAVTSAPGANTQSIKTNAVDPGHAMLGATVPASTKGRAAPPTKGLNGKERDLEMPALGVDVVEARLRDTPMSEEEARARQARIDAKLGGSPLDLLAAVKAKAGVIE